MGEKETFIQRRGFFLLAFELEGFFRGLSQALSVRKRLAPRLKNISEAW